MPSSVHLVGQLGLPGLFPYFPSAFSPSARSPSFPFPLRPTTPLHPWIRSVTAGDIAPSRCPGSTHGVTQRILSHRGPLQVRTGSGRAAGCALLWLRTPFSFPGVAGIPNVVLSTPEMRDVSRGGGRDVSPGVPPRSPAHPGPLPPGGAESERKQKLLGTPGGAQPSRTERVILNLTQFPPLLIARSRPGPALTTLPHLALGGAPSPWLRAGVSLVGWSGKSSVFCSPRPRFLYRG